MKYKKTYATYRPAPPPPKTKYPFLATINGRSVVVWPDWIERVGRDDGDPADQLEEASREP